VPSDPVSLAALSILVLIAAVLYSAVGHAGASGYLAAMALFGVPASTMKPTALVLNVLVAIIGTARFARAGQTPWTLLMPLCAGSIPAAFVGGRITLPNHLFEPLLAVLLCMAAARLWSSGDQVVGQARPRPGALVGVGMGLGFLAGLTGIGGGVFLSPIVILAGWETPRRTAGASAPFILANSIAGLIGHVSAGQPVPRQVGVLAVMAIVGGFVGSWLGATRLDQRTLRRVLAVVMVVASLKLLAAAW
jgi:uncharacterized membrane protein YfcA